MDTEKKPMKYYTIYKISCKDLDIKEGYVGSTDNYGNRQGTHKSRCSNNNCKEYNTKIYTFIRANGNWENFVMENIECYTKTEARIKEREWSDRIDSRLNTNSPFVYNEDEAFQKRKINCEKIKKERKNKFIERREIKEQFKISDEYKENIKAQRKIYNDTHRKKYINDDEHIKKREQYNICRREKYKNDDEIKEKMKKNNQNYNDKMSDERKIELTERRKNYYQNNKDKIKGEMTEENKMKIKEKKKIYYQNNKDKYNKKKEIVEVKMEN